MIAKRSFDAVIGGVTGVRREQCLPALAGRCDRARIAVGRRRIRFVEKAR